MNSNQKLLITGGAGFIGSHACVVLLEAGYPVAVMDNLCNSSREALRRVEAMTGKKIAFHKADIRDSAALNKIFGTEQPQAISHILRHLVHSDSDSVWKVALLRYFNIVGAHESGQVGEDPSGISQ